ncbi:hypothetical protein [Bacillus ndiopicus]|uniref:hypothetical protein n=1 Tax=Bacillus ndiopicus TaxID=1347368 RepID=UPI0005A95A63|nr:hypothetical protein [Bacillus ndiopicus]
MLKIFKLSFCGLFTFVLMLGLLVPAAGAQIFSLPIENEVPAELNYIEIEVTPYSRNPNLQRFDIGSLKGLTKMSDSQAMSFTRARGYDGGPHEFKESYLGKYIDKSLFNIYYINDKVNRGDVYILDKQLRGVKAYEKY